MKKEEVLEKLPATKGEQFPAKIAEVIKTSGVEMSKAQQIASNYVPFMEQILVQEAIIKKLKIGNPKDLELAKRARLDIGKIISRATDQKKLDKDLLLVETRFIDGLFKSSEGYGRLLQEDAKKIELHAERIEAEKIAKISEKRIKELEKYDVVSVPENIGTMEDATYKFLIAGAKATFESVLLAEAEAEKERKEAEEKELLLKSRTQELIIAGFSFDGNNYFVGEFKRLDNGTIMMLSDAEFKDTINAGKAEVKRLADIQIQKDKEFAELQKVVAKKEADTKAKEEKEKKDAEAKAHAEKLEKEANELRVFEIRKSRLVEMCLVQSPTNKYTFDYIDTYLGAGLSEDSRIRIEDVSDEEFENLVKKAQRWIDESNRMKMEADAQAELNKGDVAKAQDLISDLTALKTKYTFKSKNAQEMYASVGGLLDKIIGYIED